MHEPNLNQPIGLCYLMGGKIESNLSPIPPNPPFAVVAANNHYMLVLDLQLQIHLGK